MKKHARKLRPLTLRRETVYAMSDPTPPTQTVVSDTCPPTGSLRDCGPTDTCDRAHRR
jgi:hypothetical protein